MAAPHHTHRAAITLTTLTAAAGLGLLATAATHTPPPPPQPDTRPTTTSTTSPAPPLPHATPLHITIPTIDVHADIVPVATTTDGQLEVPPAGPPPAAGWYRPGVSPGEAGNAVIVGHVDSRDTGPAVFFNLGRLRPGDRIHITRADNRTATFTVDDIRAYPKTRFPTALVYGTSPTPQLRLITCGGRFDQRHHTYPDNLIVFATAVP
ncbi:MULTISPECIES: class F sortase [Micromonospora]|uniref:class F sortase n=1 Tax=Micromonospora TaxID=1873 RepID=UPI001E5A16CF|nr:class F sortase [Micromonospora sp. NBRC 110038]